jgi:hypothetical protein
MTEQELRAPFKALGWLIKGTIYSGFAIFPVWYWPLVYFYLVQPFLTASLTQSQYFLASAQAWVFIMFGFFGTWAWWREFGNRFFKWILYKS